QATLARPRELDAEEGIARRSGVDVEQPTPRHLRVDLGAQEPAHRANAQPIELQLQRTIPEGRDQVNWLVVTGSQREDDADRKRAEAADREGEPSCRRLVEPLDVVDGD